MKNLVILGGGTAGTMMSAKLRRALSPDWTITLVDQDNVHVYQPGLLFIPFGIYRSRDVVKPRARYVPPGVELVLSEIDVVDGEVTAEIRRTEFDTIAAANAISSRGLPGDVYRAATVRTGKLVR